MSGLIGASEIPFRLTAKRKEGAQDAEPCALRASTELEARVEQVTIGRRELVDRHVAPTVRVCDQLLRERAVPAEGGGGDLGALTIREEDAGRVRNGDADWIAGASGGGAASTGSPLHLPAASTAAE